MTGANHWIIRNPLSLFNMRVVAMRESSSYKGQDKNGRKDIRPRHDDRRFDRVREEWMDDAYCM